MKIERQDIYELNVHKGVDLSDCNSIIRCSIGADSKISNKALYPSTITCPLLSQPVLLLSYRKLFAKFSWTNAFMLCDDSAAIPYYVLQCREFMASNALPGVTLSSARFNSATTVNYTATLHYATKSARGNRAGERQASLFLNFFQKLL